MHYRFYRLFSLLIVLSFIVPSNVLGQELPNSEGGVFDLELPSNIDSDVRFDPATGKYIFYQEIGEGSFKYRRPVYMDFEAYKKYRYQKSLDDYWKDKIASEIGKQDPKKEERDGFKPQIKVNNKGFDRVFGGNIIDIKPQGSAELNFGFNTSKTENPSIPERQRSLTTFDFDQRMQVNVQGNIGEKLKVNFKYNTHAAFDFENQFKVEYTGYEDEIIKKIEAGNVSLPLNSSLITGSQSLFGIKTQLQFGRLTATTVLSQQKGQKNVINVSGGAQKTNFEINADEYEGNKHFFLSHFFYENYDEFMKSAPNITSGINITRMEVWVTNVTNSVEKTRNIIAFTDIGEDGAYVSPGISVTDTDPSKTLPDNDFNSLYKEMIEDPAIISFSGATPVLSDKNFQAGQHYEKVESARMLPENSYTVNKRLGFISLNQPMENDQILAVSYEYTYNGKTYQVGTFSTDGVNGTEALVVKMLKSTVPNPTNQMWDLMMKNVYSLGAFQLSKEDFYLDVLYNNPKTGVNINFIPQAPIDDSLLIQVLSLDHYDRNMNRASDGVFDFMDNAATEGGTVNSRNGRIFFPVTEPFGKHLRKTLEEGGVAPEIINSIAFESLYDSTLVIAQQQPELNRFRIKGSYQSSSGSDISLNALNIPQGAVSVSAGGVRLTENVDFTVDYNLGRVKILNQGVLESGTPLSISVESNSLFSVQTKTLLGTRLDYRVHKDFNLGATVLNLTERPLTQKVSFGDEPISNTMIGFDGNYNTEAPFLTKLVDAIPLIDTKESSSITVSGEYAQLIPGHSKAIGDAGATYIDDFEGSQYAIDVRSFNQWSLAATPQGQPDLFPEGNKSNTLENGYRRAMFNWNMKDPLFFRSDPNTPDYFSPEDQSNHFTREILETEVFPLREIAQGTPPNLTTLDLSFYPEERGPYNYNTNLEEDGSLPLAEENWGGVSRRLTTTNFETANIEFIQFWVMDPFNSDSENSSGGKLYFNLGSISEDVLRDSRKSFENGLPSAGGPPANTDTTVWGIVPVNQSVVNAFDNTSSSNASQDVGLDGLSDASEREFFNSYLTAVQTKVDATAYQAISQDPSNDNYHYYRGGDYDGQQLYTLERYKRYNGYELNSPTSEDSPESYPTSSTPLPSTEDLNLDNNLSETESYFQYEVPIFPGMDVGDPYITDVLEVAPKVKDGTKKPIKWYQFKIPVRSPDKVVNGISDYRSIRFMRMFMKGFSQPVHMRFARLELIRGEWRKFYGSLEERGEVFPGDENGSSFDIGAVNVEENGNRTPVNYILPPDIVREIDVTSTNQRNLNEQSMSLRVCNLADGDAKAAFKSTSFDVRSFEKLKMFVHAESSDPTDLIEYGDASVFIRLGSDFSENYYEYEIPLEPTDINKATHTADEIWPSRNDIEIVFDDLLNAKKERSNVNYPANQPYVKMVGNARVWVKGFPNLAEVTTLMIGVRNPSDDGPLENPWVRDDGLEKCFEVWVNELRLSDFKEDGGWAAIGRVSANLADFAKVDVAGNISKPGFGSIEKRVSERSRETKQQFDASSTIQLGKFFPEKTGLVLPLYLGFSEGKSTPQFDPLNPDIELDTRNLSRAEKRELENSGSVTYQSRRSLNLANIRKEKPADRTRKDRFYDIENVSLSYAYNEDLYKDINTEKRETKNYRVGLTYGFSKRPKTVKPLEKIAWLKSKHLKFIRDFNFNLGPKQMGFRTNLDRAYTVSKVRVNTGTLPSKPQYTKTFRWDRNYDFKYDLTRSLKFDYSAGNQALVDELPGAFEKGIDDEYGTYEEKKEALSNSIKKYGETTNFNQNVSLKYKLPINKLPFLSWINADATYQGNYSWERAPFAQDSLGHTIQNSQNIQLNTNITMTQLYASIPFLKKIQDKKRKSNRTTSRSMGIGKNLKELEMAKKGPGKSKDEGQLTALESFVSFFMGLNTVNVKYSKNRGTLLPGYDQKTKMLGMDEGFNAPGFPFVFGAQEDQFAERAAANEWLVKTPSVNRPYVLTDGTDFSYRVSAEPIKSLRIDINGSKTQTTGSESFFRWNPDSLSYENQSPVYTGNVSVSVNAFSSAFEKIEDDLTSGSFQAFMDSRTVISERLAGEKGITARDTSDANYYAGYGSNAQNVVLLSFISAYGGDNSSKVGLNPFKLIPASNWRISYDGLSRLKPFQKLFRNFSISHAYKASMSTSYTGNLGAFVDGVQQTNIAGNLVEDRQYQTISFTESFSPLINFDATLKNSFLAKVEIKKDRNINMNISNIQITEVRGNELVIGSGYRFKDVRFPILLGGKTVKSDLNLRLDVSIRDSETIIRKVVEQAFQRTAGRRVISIKGAADYTISRKLTMRLYYDQQITRPQLSVPFPTSNTRAGLSLRITLN